MFLLQYEDKTALVKSYEDLKFVDEVLDEWRCGRCGRVPIFHYFTQCDHVFCQNCKRLLSYGKTKCPKCGADIISIGKQNPEFEETIWALKVKCLNAKYGCPFISSILQLPQHLRQCDDTKEKNLPKILENIGNRKTRNFSTSKDGAESNNTIRLDKLELYFKNMEEKIIQNTEKIDKQMTRLTHEIEEVKGKMKVRNNSEDQEIKMPNQNNATESELIAKINSCNTKIDTMGWEVKALKKNFSKQFGDLKTEMASFENNFEAKTYKPDNRVVERITIIENQQINLKKEVENCNKAVDVMLKKPQDSKIGGLSAEVNNFKNIFEAKLNGVTQRISTAENQYQQLKGSVDKYNTSINVEVANLKQTSRQITEFRPELANANSNLKAQINEVSQRIAKAENQYQQLQETVNKCNTTINTEVYNLKLTSRQQADKTDGQVNKITSSLANFDKRADAITEWSTTNFNDTNARVESLTQIINQLSQQLVEAVNKANRLDYSLSDLRSSFNATSNSYSREIRESKEQLSNTHSQDIREVKDRIAKSNEKIDRTNERIVRVNERLERVKENVTKVNENLRKVSKNLRGDMETLTFLTALKW